MTGPVSSTNNAIALFDGITGALLKDSAVLLSALATILQLAGKEDKVTGKGLSEEDFTAVLKAKLDGLVSGSFLGTYATLIELEADYPTAPDGSFAFVAAAEIEQTLYVWDNTNSVWTKVALGSTPYSGAQIKSALFAEADTNDLNDARLALLNTALQQSTFDAQVVLIEAAIAGVVNDVVTETTIARTLALADDARYIRLTNAGGCTITLPTDAVAGWATNHEIRFRIETATLPTITTAATVTDVAAIAALAINTNFKLKRVAVNLWHVVVGD
jgi:hypothetical protein